MMKGKLFLICTAVLIGIIGFVNAASYQSTTFQSPPSSFQSYYASSSFDTGTSDWQTYWPGLELNKDVCKARQDLLLQVAPGGCQPMVVRSDLLAEQNVPVLCQVMGLQINPLIDIKQIKNIRFTGNYPKEVAGVGFHPAKAALRTKDQLTGSPLINNIGYVVVVLKKNPIEKNVSDFVNVTLSAQVEYTSGNVLGIGKSEFLLNEMTDEEWENERAQGLNSFWSGKASVRLESADVNNAVVSIYYGVNKLNTVTVHKGTPSQPVYLPGTYCMAGLILHYDSFETASTRAVIEINDETGTERATLNANSQFLDDNCRVGSIVSTGGGMGKVDIVCRNKRFTLTRTPNLINYAAGQRVNVTINGKEYGAEISEVLGNNQYNIKINGETTTRKMDYTSILPYITAESGDTTVLKNKDYSEYDKSGDFDSKLSELKKKFNDAIEKYNSVVRDYPYEKVNSDAPKTIAEVALENAINLAGLIGDNVKKYELMGSYVALYPQSNNSDEYRRRMGDLLRIDSSQAVTSIDINNRFRTITLISVNEPKEENKAKVILNIGLNREEISEGGYKEFTGINNQVGVITVKKVNVDSVSVSYTCTEAATNTVKEKGDEIIKSGSGKTICGRVVTFERADVKQVVKLRIIPQAEGTATETNLSVVIGIEKRNIQLSDDKKKQMIANINKSIAEWEAISAKLDKVVVGLKTMCLTTSLLLNFKNLVQGLTGETVARQETMKIWRAKCKEIIANGQEGVSTLSQCYQKHSSEINSDVSKTKTAIENVNKQVEAVDKQNTPQAGFFQDKSVNTDAAKKQLAAQIRGEYGNEYVNMPEKYAWKTFGADGKAQGTGSSKVLVKDLLADANLDDMSYAELRNIYMNLERGNAGGLSDVGTAAIGTSLGDSARRINDNMGLAARTRNETLAKEQDAGLPEGFIVSKDTTRKIITNVVSSDRVTGTGAEAVKQYPYIAKVNNVETLANDGKTTIPGATYVIGMTKADDNVNYIPKEVFKYDASTKTYTSLPLTPPAGGGPTTAQFLGTYDIGTITSVSQVSYKNKIIGNPSITIRYYETEPYKGMPAIVPFDVNNGWYAATKQTLPSFGGIGAFDSSGRVVSFRLCNVGPNHKIEFDEGYGDDICQVVNLNTGQPLDKFPGVEDAEAKALVQRAISAIEQAASKYGSKRIDINDKIAGTQSFETGAPMTNTPESDCEDFMSPGDCSILFNVCDPVICPASRCNLGGKFNVPDVIQSGIIGSAVLCLPNFGSPTEGKVLIPVCLSGIKAGIDAWVSVMKAHRDCLQESLDKGTISGMCDQLYSFYTCDFFWRQIGPMLNVLLPKLVGKLYGQERARGGGEYATVQAAFENADKSTKYMSNTYGYNALKSFQLGNIAEIGSSVCKGYISGKGPTSLDSLVEGDSPPQFFAQFNSFKYSDATVPATSQYKVLYHIFAGKTQSVYYQIYLKNPPESSYYSMNQRIDVASGTISAGEYKDETKDFTAPEGYKELCVRINADEKCGFKQVSTSMGLNYLRDSYVAGQMAEADITSEKDCISGSPDLSALLTNTNPQSAAEEAALPEIYNRGVIRICSSDNPGSSTDPTRFVKKGYCDSEKIGCWLDTRSVKNAITAGNNLTMNQTLSQLQMDLASLEDKPLLTSNESDAEIRAIEDYIETQLDVTNDADVKTVIARIDSVFNRVFMNSHKARLLFDKARVYGRVAEKAHSSFEWKKYERVLTAPAGGAVTPGTTPAETPESAGYVLVLDKMYTGAEGVSYKILLGTNGPETGLVIKDRVLSLDGAPVGTVRGDGTITVGKLDDPDYPLKINDKTMQDGDSIGNYLDGAKIVGTGINRGSGEAVPAAGLVLQVDSKNTFRELVYYNGKKTNISIIRNYNLVSILDYTIGSIANGNTINLFDLSQPDKAFLKNTLEDENNLGNDGYNLLNQATIEGITIVPKSLAAVPAASQIVGVYKITKVGSINIDLLAQISSDGVALNLYKYDASKSGGFGEEVQWDATEKQSFEETFKKQISIYNSQKSAVTISTPANKLDIRCKIREVFSQFGTIPTGTYYPSTFIFNSASGPMWQANLASQIKSSDMCDYNSDKANYEMVVQYGGKDTDIFMKNDEVYIYKYGTTSYTENSFKIGTIGSDGKITLVADALNLMRTNSVVGADKLYSLLNKATIKGSGIVPFFQSRFTFSSKLVSYDFNLLTETNTNYDAAEYMVNSKDANNPSSAYNLNIYLMNYDGDIINAWTYDEQLDKRYELTKAELLPDNIELSWIKQSFKAARQKGINGEQGTIELSSGKSVLTTNLRLPSRIVVLDSKKNSEIGFEYDRTKNVWYYVKAYSSTPTDSNSKYLLSTPLSWFSDQSKGVIENLPTSEKYYSDGITLSAFGRVAQKLENLDEVGGYKYFQVFADSDAKAYGAPTDLTDFDSIKITDVIRLKYSESHDAFVWWNYAENVPKVIIRPSGKKILASNPRTEVVCIRTSGTVDILPRQSCTPQTVSEEKIFSRPDSSASKSDSEFASQLIDISDNDWNNMNSFMGATTKDQLFELIQQQIQNSQTKLISGSIQVPLGTIRQSATILRPAALITVSYAISGAPKPLKYKYDRKAGAWTYTGGKLVKDMPLDLKYRVNADISNKLATLNEIDGYKYLATVKDSSTRAGLSITGVPRTNSLSDFDPTKVSNAIQIEFTSWSINDYAYLWWNYGDFAPKVIVRPNNKRFADNNAFSDSTGAEVVFTNLPEFNEVLGKINSYDGYRDDLIVYDLQFLLSIIKSTSYANMVNQITAEKERRSSNLAISYSWTDSLGF